MNDQSTEVIKETNPPEVTTDNPPEVNVPNDFPENGAPLDPVDVPEEPATSPDDSEENEEAPPSEEVDEKPVDEQEAPEAVQEASKNGQTDQGRPNDTAERAVSEKDAVPDTVVEKGPVTEAELTKRSTAPRVTENEVYASIKKTDYFVHEGSCLTLCVITMQNGFTVVGEAACADAANFKQDIGERIARENAIKKIWPLLGYQLRDKLHNEPKDYVGRLKQEFEEVNKRLQKLIHFIDNNPTFKELTDVKRSMLREQRETMASYTKILDGRIQLEEINL